LVASPRQNKLLAAIQWQKFHQALRPVFMPLGHVVFEPNVQRKRVYFPTTSIISFSYMLTGGGMMPSREIVQSRGGPAASRAGYSK
jgi:hypothetical protein